MDQENEQNVNEQNMEQNVENSKGTQIDSSAAKPSASWDQYLNQPVNLLIGDGVSESTNSKPIPEVKPFIEGKPLEQKTGTVWDNYLHQNIPIPNVQDIISPASQTSLIQEVTAPIVSKLNEIQKQMDDLRKKFEDKLMDDTHKDKLIDNLYKELQEHKDGLVKKFMKSMIMDLIKIIDNIRKLTNHYNAQDLSDTDPAKLLKVLDSIPSDLEDLFSWQDVKSYSCDGETFAPSKQRVLRTVETSDKSKDKTIAERLRPGYEWEGTMIRPEMVSVYVYKEIPIQTEMRNSNG